MTKKTPILVIILVAFLSSCNSDSTEALKVEPIKYKYGYDESKFSFEEKKVGRGDTFGDILEDQGIDYPENSLPTQNIFVKLLNVFGTFESARCIFKWARA